MREVKESRTVVVIVVLTAVWAAILLIADWALSKPAPRGPAVAVPPAAPALTMRITHLCCTGCRDSVFQALKGDEFVWLGSPSLMAKSPPQPLSAQPRSNRSNTTEQTTAVDDASG